MIAILLALTFLVGSIPFGLLVARAAGLQDVREHGSGNIGATNVARVRGWGPGFATLFLDLLKGAAVPLLLQLEGAQFVLNRVAEGLRLEPTTLGVALVWWCGFFAVAGHCFSPFVRFKGGKGVATGLGAALALTPWAALGGVVAFLFFAFRSRIVSLASIVSLFATTLVEICLHGVSQQHWAGLAVIWLIILRHEKNIDALLSGTEKTFSSQVRAAS